MPFSQVLCGRFRNSRRGAKEKHAPAAGGAVGRDALDQLDTWDTCAERVLTPASTKQQAGAVRNRQVGVLKRGAERSVSLRLHDEFGVDGNQVVRSTFIDPAADPCRGFVDGDVVDTHAEQPNR